jgi:pyruvate/2-oxoglutarate dehydrogenase complex dihydrolipoamide acyltransferase (E2) component
MKHRRRELVLPELGLKPGTVQVSVWLVPRGGRVVCGDRILEVVAGDVTIDLPSPATGRLVEQHVVEDDPLETGQLLGVVEELEEDS